jgi:hypothetical protein
MAKKGKGKIIQMLSPENYIRQKARTLPLYECWINAEWNEGKMATLIVAQLDRITGKGNYYLMNEEGDIFNE